MNCKVSIIVLTYNHEKYIEKALDSIISQNISSIEILVGDDASNDKTPEILKKYAEQYPDFIKVNLLKENIGASKNLYTLLLQASGDYIALLEGDDWWLDKNKLNLQIEFLEKNKEYSGCTHDCLIVDSTDRMIKKQKKFWILNKQIFTMNDCKGFFLSGQTGTLVFRNIFKDNNHNYEIIYKAHPMISDRTIQLILTAFGPIYHFDKKMSVYRNNSSDKGENATALIFVDNPQGILENYFLTIALEHYIKKEFDISLNCEPIKRMFFTVALVKAIIKPSREKWKIVSTIFLNKETKKMQYVILIPYEIIKRLVYRIKERL